MEKDKKKKILQVISLAVLFLNIGVVMFKLIELGVQKARERQEQEAIQEKEDKKNSKVKAEKYIKTYAEKLQNEMRDAGIADLRVVYTECSYEYFDEYWGTDDYESADYAYYYMLDYYSDSIDAIYAANTAGGNFEPFIELMSNVGLVESNREGWYKNSMDIEMGDKTIAVYIGDKNLTNDMTVKKEPDQTYSVEGRRWVYVNGKEVYAKTITTNNSGSSGSGNSGSGYSGSSYSGNNYSGSSSRGSSSGSSSKYDPYDVYDYDDPDDFADEWAEEFGDGSYDDGYDDAYDYWDETH